MTSSRKPIMWCYVQYPSNPDLGHYGNLLQQDYYIGENTTRIIEKRFNIRKGAQSMSYGFTRLVCINPPTKKRNTGLEP